MASLPAHPIGVPLENGLGMAGALNYQTSPAESTPNYLATGPFQLNGDRKAPHRFGSSQTAQSPKKPEGLLFCRVLME